MIENIYYVVLLIIVFVIGIVWGVFAGLEKGFSIVRTTQFVVESAHIEKVTTNTGLVIENKGFNVGDTLVIRKK